MIEMDSVSVSPHLVHVKVLIPASVQVASLVTVPESHVCPVAGVAFPAVVLSPHAHDEPAVYPPSVHVAGISYPTFCCG